jgi:hypothetical protein
MRNKKQATNYLPVGIKTGKNGGREMAKAKKEKFVAEPKVQTIDCEIVVNELAGGRPMNNNVLQNWMNSLAKKDKLSVKEADQIVENNKQIEEAIEEHTNGFKMTADGIYYIEDRQIKAMFKEAMLTLNLLNRYPGPLRHHFQTGFAINPRVIALGRTEPDRVDENFIHAIDQTGAERHSLSRVIILEKVKISFLIQNTIGTERCWTADQIESALVQASRFVGIGANRSQGMGVFEITKFDVYPAVDIERISCRKNIEA